MKLFKFLLVMAAAFGIMMVLLGTAANASVNQTFTATMTGTSVTSPVNGTLYVYDNATAFHHTRSVEYYDHDGYHKKAVLQTSANPLGVVLKAEDIENNCGNSQNPGAVNPTGGTGVNCLPVLHQTEPAPYPVTGDLAGRYCRVPPPGFHLPCPFNVFRSETATGTGQYLTVGDKDHGALLKVVYYTNVTGTDYEVTVKLPFGTTALPNGVLVTRIVLLPQGVQPPHAVLVLQ